MGVNDDSLWPEDLLDGGVETPASILRDAARELAERTQAVLEGDVEMVDYPGTELTYRFVVRAPGLSNYRYELLRATHGVQLYPVTLHGSVAGEGKTAADEHDLRRILKEIFSGDPVRRLVAGLMSMSEGTIVP